MHLLNKEYTHNSEHSGDNNIGGGQVNGLFYKTRGAAELGDFHKCYKITDICNCVTTQPSTHTVPEIPRNL